MKAVLTCGHPDSGYRLAQEALVSAGLAQAQPSRRDSVAAEALHDGIFKAHNSESFGRQLVPGQAWKDLAVDLLAANEGQELWGWADARIAWLLDFWKSLDQGIGFVLVYSAPEIAVAKMLRSSAGTPENVDKAIASWMAWNMEMLRFYNRNPGRCLLVNVLAVAHAPARFVEKAAATFGSSFHPPSSSYRLEQAGISAVASSLAKAFIEVFDEAAALYRELESSSDLDSAAVPVAEAEKHQAWLQYSDLLAKLAGKAEEAREQAERANRLWQECEGAKLALSQARKRVDEQSATLDEAQALATASRAQVAQLQKRVDEQSATLNEAQALATASQAQVAQLQSRSNELSQENGLLLLQLKQIQEEFDQHLGKYQELASDVQRDAEKIALQGRIFRDQVTEVLIDMRQDIEGENWYYAEHDGRWAGPEEVSSIRIPSLRSGSHKVQLEVVDAMEPEILYGMEVSLNGTPLEISKDWDCYPALVRASFVTQEIAESPVWEFQFKFPRLVSPAQHGSEDRRNLAIRLRSITVRSID